MILNDRHIDLHDPLNHFHLPDQPSPRGQMSQHGFIEDPNSAQQRPTDAADPTNISDKPKTPQKGAK